MRSIIIFFECHDKLQTTEKKYDDLE